MSDILSQDEMDALLGALSPQGLEKEKPKADNVQSLTNEDFLNNRSSYVSGKTKPKIKLYDFRRPDRFSNEQMRTLQILHENFGRLFAASLSTQLRTVVEIKVISTSQVTFEEFTKNVPNPTNINIFSMSPLQGTGILEMNSTLVFILIDRILGGPGNPPLKQRELTDIETTVAEKIVKKALDNLQQAWQHAGAFNFKLEAMESNPMFVQIVSPAETVSLITLEVKVKNITSIINICFPYVVLESIISKLSAHQWFAIIKKAENGVAKSDLKKGLQTANVPVIAQLGSTHITVKDLLKLKNGDVVRLDNSVKENIKVFVGNRHTFDGKPGLYRRKKAVQIVSVLNNKEEGVDV